MTARAFLSYRQCPIDVASHHPSTAYKMILSFITVKVASFGTMKAYLVMNKNVRLILYCRFDSINCRIDMNANFGIGQKGLIISGRVVIRFSCRILSILAKSFLQMVKMLKNACECLRMSLRSLRMCCE